MGVSAISRTLKLALALLVPPTPAMMLGVAAFVVVGNNTNLYEATRVAAGFGLIASIMVGFPAMALLGLPGHAVLLQLRKTAFWHYAFFGALAGIVTVFALSAMDGRFYRELLVLAAFIGLANAALFWLIRRPDRDAGGDTGDHGA